jgi:5-methylcytosine-specific restriction endonuclease McrA
MTIRVTLQKDGRSIRREYKTHVRAIRALERWFSDNIGMALIYQPGEQPIVYRSKHELPITKSNMQTNFYRTKAWRELRLSILLASDCSCKICGNTSEKGAILHVDHIKPRSLYPELALDESNLQVLCEDCNIAKSNNDY